jgi:hypothetical protein
MLAIVIAPYPFRRGQRLWRKNVAPARTLHCVSLVVVLLVLQLLLSLAMWFKLTTTGSNTKFRLDRGCCDETRDSDSSLISFLHRNNGLVRAGGAIPTHDSSSTSQETNNIDAPMSTKVPLVVGGSDGSGTRAFVRLLASMGVPMLLDDAVTMDIGASLLYAGQGWPPLVKEALLYRKYPVDQWPSSVQNQSQFQLHKLRSHLDKRSARQLRKLQSMYHIMSSQLATSVSYGFKAPITMVLVPLIQAYLYPTGFKYVHVVRDGRDIALSSNQSPLKKFFNATYPDDAAARLARFRTMTPVLAMQLWNDWNADLFEWAQHHANQKVSQWSSTSTSSSSSSNATTSTAAGGNFDYLVVRSEDFLHPETKFQAMQRLAHFVGSPLTNEELCCLSRKETRDMGQSGWYKNKNPTNDTTTTTTKTTAEDIGRLSQAAAVQTDMFHSIAEARASLAQTHRIPPGMLQVDAMNRRKWIQDSVLLRTATVHGMSSLGGVGSNAAAVPHQEDGRNWLNVLIGRTPNPTAAPIVRRRTKNMTKLDYGDETLGRLFASQLDELYARHNRTTTTTMHRTVEERYGKWSKLVDPNSNLSMFLHREGARALHIFGYTHDNGDTESTMNRSTFVADIPDEPGGPCHGSTIACPPSR